MDNSERNNPPALPVEQATPPADSISPPQKPRTDSEKLIDLAQNSKLAKTVLGIAKIIHEEREGLRRCKVAIGIIAVIVGGAMWWITAAVKNHTASKLEEKLHTTEGKLQQSEKDTDKLQKANQDATTKYNEQLRQKDSEILKLSNEGEALKTRIIFLETIPDRVIETATNAITMVQNGLTNWQQYAALNDTMRSLTNDLQKFTQEPSFVVRFNGAILTTELTVLPFTTKGVNSILLENVGPTTADGTCVRFSATLEETNIISDGWLVQPRGELSTKPAMCRLWMAEQPIESSTPPYISTFNVTSIGFTTDVLSRTISCHLDVYAKNAKRQSYTFLMSPTNNFEAAKAWFFGLPK